MPKEKSLKYIAFAVDASYRKKGIGSSLHRMLMKAARKNGLDGFNATVSAINTPMLKTFQKNAPFPRHALLSEDMYELIMPFSKKEAPSQPDLHQAPLKKVYQFKG